jgi:hypothetical protein
MADRSRDPTIGCFAASNLSGQHDLRKLILTRRHEDVNTNDASDRTVRRARFILPHELK